MLNRILPTRPRSSSQASRSETLGTGSFDAAGPSTPQMSGENGQFASTAFSHNPRRVSSNMSAWSQKLSPRALLATPSVPPRAIDPDAEAIPREMIPALTLLAAHGSRIYIEGYFMLLAELNAEGQPVPNPRWIEVFGTLQGTVITMWDAALLEEGRHDTSYINIGDGYMRSVETLDNNLQNVIVLSTTMKNRYLLQFGTKKLFNEWTAALRLATFERTALQEAYTGALLSAKGARLRGIRALLTETKHRQELWCQVRFGVGMPWRHVWAVITPNVEIPEKKERKKRGHLGKIELYNDPRDTRKKKATPVATIERVSAAFAVFPEKSVLVDVSSLIKMEGFVLFQNEQEERETAIFLMPDPHPGIEGYETLIRFLIPVLDVFSLYGRPQRLNADKNDINSLLFGMPTLPRAHYLDVIDVYMLATLKESPDWSASEWSSRIKELIARKMAMGFRGTGSVNRSGSTSDTSSVRNSPARQRKPRAVSDPNGVKLFSTPSPTNDTSTTAASSTSSLVNKQHAPAVPSPLQHSRAAPKAPNQPSQISQPPTLLPEQSSTTPLPAAPVQVYPQPSGYATDPSSSKAATRRVPVPVINTEPNVPKGPRPGPDGSLGNEAGGSLSNHTRVKSEGGNRIPGLLTPQLGDESAQSQSQDLDESPHSSKSRPTLASADSFASATDGGDMLDFGLNDKDTPNVFDPAYRPTHQSYADYSEYMKQYLNRSLGSGDARTLPTEREVDEEASTPSTPRGKINGTAKLLDTPIRTPELSVAGTPTAAEESARSAGDSPPSDALDSLVLPRPVSGVGAQRRPSGPRPDPNQPQSQLQVPGGPRPAPAGEPDVQSRSPYAASAGTSQPRDDLNFFPNPYAPAGGQAPQYSNQGLYSPSRVGPSGGYTTSPGPSGPGSYGQQQQPLGANAMFHPGGFNFKPPGPRGSPGPHPGDSRGPWSPGSGAPGGMPSPARSRVPVPGPFDASNPFVKPGFGGPPASRNGAAPAGYGGSQPPAGYGGGVPPGYGGGPPPDPLGSNTSMPGSLPFERNILGYGPGVRPGPYGAAHPGGGQPGGMPPNVQSSPAKAGPQRALNEVRAQQLRDTRAQAKNNGGYPSFH